MTKRALVQLEDVASLEHLGAAFWRAAKGKRQQPEVRAFEANLLSELARLGREILEQRVRVGSRRSFTIHDPKRRVIQAPCFRERVLHHALMARVGPVLERLLVDDTFACRLGKGTLAAVKRAQCHTARYGWFVKLDVRAYFASIDHAILRSQLRRRIKGAATLHLIDRIIASYLSPATDQGSREGLRGLPIGALTSQHFANLYLASLDRLLLEGQGVAMVRYMDDVAIWGNSPAVVRAAAQQAVAHADQALHLTIKPHWQVQPSCRGLPLLGFRIFGDRLLLSRRRRRRYATARRRFETAYLAGLIDGQQLQAGYASVYAVTAHAEARAWRREELVQRGSIDA